jgi:hypothetical protein
MKKCKHLLDYLTSHPDASVHFHASNMILNIHSNASYLSKLNAHSHACKHIFMGWKPNPTKPIKLNGAFFTLCAILRFVVLSAGKAKLGALFLNCKQATISNSSWKKWAIPNHPPQLTTMILPQLALPINPSNGNVHHGNAIFLGCRCSCPKEV